MKCDRHGSLYLPLFLCSLLRAGVDLRSIIAFFKMLGARAVLAVLLIAGAASAFTTPSPTPDPCAWQSVSENTGWDFGDRDGDGKADYFRWAAPELIQLKLRATGASFTHFPRDALRRAVGPALGVAYFVCQAQVYIGIIRAIWAHHRP